MGNSDFIKAIVCKVFGDASDEEREKLRDFEKADCLLTVHEVVRKYYDVDAFKKRFPLTNAYDYDEDKKDYRRSAYSDDGCSYFADHVKVYHSSEESKLSEPVPEKMYDSFQRNGVEWGYRKLDEDGGYGYCYQNELDHLLTYLVCRELTGRHNFFPSRIQDIGLLMCACEVIHEWPQVVWDKKGISKELLLNAGECPNLYASVLREYKECFKNILSL
jgi:hypothetical protein